MNKLILVTVLCYFVSDISAALDKEFVAKFMEKMHKIAEECIKETGATEADVGELMAHILPPKTHEGKCMIFCVDRHFEIMNEDGSINHEGALKSMEPLREADEEVYGKVLKVFQTCGSKAVIEEDPCETATGLAKCAMEEGTKLGLKEDFLEV